MLITGLWFDSEEMAPPCSSSTIYPTLMATQLGQNSDIELIDLRGNGAPQ